MWAFIIPGGVEMLNRREFNLSDAIANMKCYDIENPSQYMYFGEFVEKHMGQHDPGSFNKTTFLRAEKEQVVLRMTAEEFNNPTDGLRKIMLQKNISNKKQLYEMFVQDEEESSKHEFAVSFCKISPPFTSLIAHIYGFKTIKIDDNPNIMKTLKFHMGDFVNEKSDSLDFNKKILYDVLETEIAKYDFLLREMYNKVFGQWLMRSLKEYTFNEVKRMFSTNSEIRKILDKLNNE